MVVRGGGGAGLRSLVARQRRRVMSYILFLLLIISTNMYIKGGARVARPSYNVCSSFLCFPSTILLLVPSQLVPPPRGVFVSRRLRPPVYRRLDMDTCRGN